MTLQLCSSVLGCLCIKRIDNCPASAWLESSGTPAIRNAYAGFIHMDTITSTQSPMLPTLPGMRHLSELADCRPTIVIDTREQTPLPISRLPVVTAGLYSGDYSVAGLECQIAVERKSIADLVSCCAGSNRDRFENELERLRGYRMKRLLVIGDRCDIEAGNYRSAIKPAAVLGTLNAFECRYDTPVVFAATPEAGARLVELWAWYFAREYVNTINDMLRGCRRDDPQPTPSVAPHHP